MRELKLDMSGKAGIVTGAARGIGRAIAEGLSGTGAKVLLVDRDSQVELTAQDLGAEAHVADLSEMERRRPSSSVHQGSRDAWISSSTQPGLRPADRRWTWTTKVGRCFTR
jgi:NAD(P)-dependent dehydrogenase (short-subunit alcohol dehydrogenase family)